METNKEYLQRLLPLLKQEIKSQWRVQSFSKNKPSATVLCYIDQRDLMDVLDAHCEYGWEKKYEEHAGNLFCSIGIHMPDGTIHWRSDCGIESNQDAEKGRASDAAKRAGVNWGVGRFLYDKGVEYVTTNAIKADQDRVDGDKVYKRFPDCIDEQGKKIWDLTEYINNKKTPAKQPTQVKEPTQHEKTTNMGVKKELTKAELRAHTEKITAIVSADGLAGYFNSLAEPLKANEQILDLLKKQRTTLNKLTTDGAK